MNTESSSSDSFRVPGRTASAEHRISQGYAFDQFFAAYRFHLAQDDGLIAPVDHASRAAARAHAEVEANKRGLLFHAEYDAKADEEWDGEGVEPRYILRCTVHEKHRFIPCKRGPALVTRIIGINELDDPKMRVATAELFAEAIAFLDAADEDRETIRGARIRIQSSPDLSGFELTMPDTTKKPR